MTLRDAFLGMSGDHSESRNVLRLINEAGWALCAAHRELLVSRQPHSVDFSGLGSFDEATAQRR